MTYEELIQLTKDGVEIWKSVVGYEGYYEISNFGRVRSIDRKIKQKDHFVYWKGKIKRQNLSKKGYPAVTLCKDGKSRQCLIHRILMETFVPNPENKPEVDHINTIKTDNRLENLRWATHKENSNNLITIQHFIDDANSKIQKQKRLISRKIKGNQHAPITVYQYTKEGEFVAEYFSSFEAQRKTGIYCTAIRQALDCNTKTAGGFMWCSYLNDNVMYKEKMPSNTIPIAQYTIDGEFVKEWKSITRAAKNIGCSIDLLSRCVKKNIPYNGYIFKTCTIN